MLKMHPCILSVVDHDWFGYTVRPESTVYIMAYTIYTIKGHIYTVVYTPSYNPLSSILHSSALPNTIAIYKLIYIFLQDIVFF